MLREPGVQDQPFRQKRQTRVGGRKEWRGNGPQREEVQTFPEFPQCACSCRGAFIKTKPQLRSRRLRFSHRRMDLLKLFCSHFCSCENIALTFQETRQFTDVCVCAVQSHFPPCNFFLFCIAINMFWRTWLTLSLVSIQLWFKVY